MEFNREKAIFLQIADLLFESILKGKWGEQERIPSTREMAVSLEVNPNTVMRTYTYLQEQEVLFNRRGIGYFVSGSAKKKIRAIKQEEFVRTELPRLVKWMRLLDIEFDDLKRIYNEAKHPDWTNLP